MTELEDFLAFYPDPFSGDFAAKMFCKKEFYDLKLEPYERVPEERGKYLKHQILLSRFVSPYTKVNRLLLFHGLGSGKTCTSIAIEEQRKAYLTRKKLTLKRALVLVTGTTLALNFKNELATKCTVSKYLPENWSNREEMNRKRNKLIKQAYIVTTFGTFLNSLGKIDSEQYPRLVAEYDDSLIIIDEVHNIRIQFGKKERKDLYTRMHSFLHTVKRCKVLLLTATPIWDQAYEIASILNLLLPTDHQLPTGEDFDRRIFDINLRIPHSSYEYLRDHMMGLISYLRAFSTTAKIVEKGQSAPWFTYLKVFPTVTSLFQYQIIREAVDRDKAVISVQPEETQKKARREGSFERFSRQAASFVFPDRSYGAEGYDKYIHERTLLIKREYQDEIKKRLPILSAKFNDVIQQIVTHPNELFFVYSEFVTGSGVILFGALLHLFGLKRATGREIEPDKTTRKYALITGKTTPEARTIERIKDTFNRPENQTGDLIQVFVASHIASQGITLKRVRKIHILTPHWNLSEIDQAIGRCLRLDSHEDIENPIVDIYRHVSALSDPNNPSQFSAETTPDIEIYQLAESKDFKNQQIYRVMKQVAIDCGLMYKRNVLERDEDYSRICNYDRCDYDCSGLIPTRKRGSMRNNYDIEDQPVCGGEVEKSTYDLLYSEDEISQASREIVELFEKYGTFYIRIEDIYSVLQLDSFIVLRAIDSLISNRVLINSIYGFPSYIKENNGLLFLDTNVKSGREFSDAYYVENPYVISKVPLSEAVESREFQSDNQSITVCPTTKEGMKTMIEGLHYCSRIVLLETAFALTQREDVPPQGKEKALMALEIMGRYFSRFDQGVVHKMHIEEHRGRGYSVTKLHMKLTGKMRLWDPNLKSWRYATGEEEKMFNELIRKSRTRTLEDYFDENNTWGFCGTISGVDKKFRIISKAQANKRQGTGMACTPSIKKPQLVEMLIQIGYEPTDQEYLNFRKYPALHQIQKPRLMVLAQQYKRYASVIGNISSKSEPELRRLIFLFSHQNNQLCDLLKKILESKGYLFFE